MDAESSGLRSMHWSFLRIMLVWHSAGVSTLPHLRPSRRGRSWRSRGWRPGPAGDVDSAIGGPCLPVRRRERQARPRMDKRTTFGAWAVEPARAVAGTGGRPSTSGRVSGLRWSQPLCASWHGRVYVAASCRPVRAPVAWSVRRVTGTFAYYAVVPAYRIEYLQDGHQSVVRRNSSRRWMECGSPESRQRLPS